MLVEAERQLAGKMVSQRETADVARIRDIISKDKSNRRCAECGERMPGYVCLNFNTFVCTVCSGILREFTFRVKGISVSYFTQEEIDAIACGGNAKAARYFMAKLESENLKPTPGQYNTIRQFIQRKYIEKCWVDDEASSDKSFEHDGSSAASASMQRKKRDSLKSGRQSDPPKPVRPLRGMKTSPLFRIQNNEEPKSKSNQTRGSLKLGTLTYPSKHDSDEEEFAETSDIFDWSAENESYDNKTEQSFQHFDDSDIFNLNISINEGENTVDKLEALEIEDPSTPNSVGNKQEERCSLERINEKVKELQIGISAAYYPVQSRGMPIGSMRNMNTLNNQYRASETSWGQGHNGNNVQYQSTSIRKRGQPELMKTSYSQNTHTKTSEVPHTDSATSANQFASTQTIMYSKSERPKSPSGIQTQIEGLFLNHPSALNFDLRNSTNPFDMN